MPTYKLYNFNLRGRVEFIRYMFHYGNIPFEDHRIDFTFADGKIAPGPWDTYKPKMPMGQVPVLEVDGKDMIPQSMAIGRFVAKKAKLYGSNDLEAAQIDAFIDSGVDAMTKAGPAIRAMVTKNEDLKKEEWAKVRDDVIKVFQIYEKTLQKNGSGWLVGKSLSAADFFVGELAERLETQLEPAILKDLPNLKKLTKAIANLPKVKEYIATRPKTI